MGCGAVQVRSAIPGTRVIIVLSGQESFVFVRWMAAEEFQLFDVYIR